MNTRFIPRRCPTMLTALTLIGSTGLAPAALAQTGDAATVEELRRIIEQQQRQLEQQAQALESLRQQVERISQQPPPTDTAAPAPTAQAAVADAPGVVKSGNDRVKLTVSGQVNRGLLFVDDGEKTETFNVDNDSSSTRVRFVGEAQATDDLTIGTNIEVQFESNSTAEVNQDDQRNVGPNSFTERKLELYVDSARYGRLTLGQGDTASNGAAEVDLSGTALIGYSSVADMAGGILFRGDSGELSDITVGDAFSNLDGLSRDDRIRYDTPDFAGFSFATSYIANDRWDAALRYGGDFGAVKAAAAIAYADPNDEDLDNRVSGSFSLLHDSGVSLTAAAGRDKRNDDRDPEFWYVKLGYQARFFNWGDSAIGVDYYRGDDIDTIDEESTSYGAFLVQNVDNYGTELYLGLRNHELDVAREGIGDVDDVFAVLAGARVKF